MVRAVSIFAVTFIVVLVVNQSGYGNCYAAYCISSALPKVVVLSVLISAFIHFSSKKKDGSD